MSTAEQVSSCTADLDRIAPVVDPLPVPADLAALRKNFGQAVQKRIDKAVARQREAERRADWYAQLSTDLITMCRELFTLAKGNMDRQSQAEFLQELVDVQKEMQQWQNKK